MNTIKSKKIAIIGAGPGGLTLARLLQMNGSNIKVYERDAHADARPKGATLDLHDDSGLKAIREAGLMDAFMANYRPDAGRMRIADKNANIVLEDNEEKEGAHFRPEIDRGPLQKILLESLQPGTVIWDSQFSALHPQGAGWQIDFKNGNSNYADVVIAADGANSKIRPYITPIKPFYSGVTVVEGAVYNSAIASPRIHQLLNGGKIFAMGDEKSIIVSSKGDGSLVFYTGCNKPEHWGRESGIDFTDKTQVIAWFKREFTGWDNIWLELFESADAAFVLRPQYCMPLDQTWDALPNLTILGDAAHLMPPYAGEGVNMAMLDALELSQCLTGDNFTDLPSAIAAYENQMRMRASQVAATTMESTAALHSKDALAYLIDVIS
ncbi:NAD(P)/FAD-dependent oxidoreductase [Mucilaginibacter sp. OK283]|uniref:FAD-dependent oxidoreductase n=1 Tax=Mucilaginibacter sp. OK283 TaxID=1881049 RepID=UPI0008B2BA73|nr:NAD(P)/FAD-dependent oxidoreductase [Mucilaginibacter sp. OK283]SEO19695.1 2-polyprenyl-6-methoxyphenol hydroxylase [Mucilaginibacter sp. OK283]